MSVLSIVKVLAVVCIGLTAGIYIDYSASAPARATLSASSFVQYQQIVHIHYVWMLPTLIITGVLAALTWLLMIKTQWKTAEFWLVATSIGGILFIVVITRTVSVPLNNQLMTWSISGSANRSQRIMAALGAG